MIWNSPRRAALACRARAPRGHERRLGAGLSEPPDPLPRRLRGRRIERHRGARDRAEDVGDSRRRDPGGEPHRRERHHRDAPGRAVRARRLHHDDRGRDRDGDQPAHDREPRLRPGEGLHRRRDRLEKPDRDRHQSVGLGAHAEGADRDVERRRPHDGLVRRRRHRASGDRDVQHGAAARRCTFPTRAARRPRPTWSPATPSRWRWIWRRCRPSSRTARCAPSRWSAKAARSCCRTCRPRSSRALPG